jgi:hypothetical protein
MYGCLKFLLSYFEYRQIWLNVLTDYCHSSSITKLKKNHWTVGGGKTTFCWVAVSSVAFLLGPAPTEQELSHWIQLLEVLPY